MFNMDEVKEQVLEIQELSGMDEEQLLKDFITYCKILQVEPNRDSFDSYHSDSMSFL